MPLSTWDCLTQCRTAVSVRSNSRATWPAVLPLDRTFRTTSALNSSVKLRRIRLGFCSGMSDTVYASRLVSTRPDPPREGLRRSLRRPAEEYASRTPAVCAARLLGWKGERGRVSYRMAYAGPEPLELRSGAPLDHRYYVEHQFPPIARSVAEASGWEACPWFGKEAQLGLSF